MKKRAKRFALFLSFLDYEVDVFKLPCYTLIMNDKNWGGKREGAGRKKGDTVYHPFVPFLKIIFYAKTRRSFASLRMTGRSDATTK